MQHNELIDALVRDLRPVRRASTGAQLALVGAIGGIELMLLFVLHLTRPDLYAALSAPMFWWKCATFAALALAGSMATVRSLAPARSPRGGLRALGTLAGVAAAGLALVAQRWSWQTSAALEWQAGIGCVAEMLAWSLPAFAVLAILMRRGAPTDTVGTSWSSGFAAAGWGVFVFSFTCPHDEPAFIAVWYPLGTLAIAAAARLALPRLTRW
jgi:hypothetical protein